MVMEEQSSDMELAAERVPVPQIQKSLTVPSVEVNNKYSGVSRGTPRMRKKALHAGILKQMEFYFSDSNLSKDRFLGNLIKEDPYVDLSIFTKFNKIRELTTDINRIAKALQSSAILSISEDGTKVRRTTPIKPKENVDEYTIYVENLPPDANHDWVISVFSKYGPVAYVSIPRYKSNKKIKGFAFVEFDTLEGTEQCIKAFHKKGCVLPSHTSPDELLSITTFDNVEKDVTMEGKFPDRNNMCLDDNIDEENEEVDTQTNNVDEDMEHEDEKLSKSDEFKEEYKETKKPKKRKHDSISCDIDADLTNDDQMVVEPKKHKKKKDKHSDESVQSQSSNNHFEDEGLDRDVPPEKQKNKELDLKSENDTIDESSKKLRKKQKKSKSSEEIKNDEPSTTSNQSEDILEKENTEVSSDEKATTKKKKKRKRKRSKFDDTVCDVGLQIMTKKDWKYLRNKYLELQRSKMKQLKQHLKKTRWTQWSNHDKNKSEREENDNTGRISKTENISHTNLSFTPGVIVKVDLNEPCTDPKGLKMELKGNSTVKYIDVSEGAFHMYIRHDTPESAQSFLQKSNKDKSMLILKDEEERMYWDKIMQDREDKLGKTHRVKQRGRNKLLKRAEKELGKHIKFDEV